MGRTHVQRLVARDGYFGPESMVRLLGNSPLTPFLGGGAAVLLQAAHPLVAYGVVRHSGFDRDLWRRLTGTLRALYLITFGDKREAERAGVSVQAAPLPAPLRLLAPAHRLASTYLLPDRLRREYGLRWSPLHELALPLAGCTVRYGTAPVLTLATHLPTPKVLAA